MRPQIVKILTLVLFAFNSTIMLAQSKGGDSGPPPPSQNRTPGLPIDNNILILIIIGLLYGVYVTYKNHQAKNTHS